MSEWFWGWLWCGAILLVLAVAILVWVTPEWFAQFSAMTVWYLVVIIWVVSVGAIERNDRLTGQRLRAASTSSAPTLPDSLAREELLEHLLGPGGVLAVYGRELAHIGYEAGVLRRESRLLLDQVRGLQARPLSPREAAR